MLNARRLSRKRFHNETTAQTKHGCRYGITAELERLVPGCKIAYADVLTEGAACTTLLAGDLIDNDAPLVIVNSDQVRHPPGVAGSAARGPGHHRACQGVD